MRLVCPNCAAQYEVDAALIPAAGRDVQCSACGTTWFQPGAPEAAAPDSAPAPTPTPEAAPGYTDAWFDYDEDPDPLPAPEPAPRRALDESLLSVLREEAEREARARRAEGTAPPADATDAAVAELLAAAGTTPPAKAAEKPAEPAAQPAARPRPVIEPVAEAEPEPEPEEIAPPPPRRDLLPDIEEINSTLRATPVRSAVEREDTAPKRRGFASGFSFSLLIAAILLALYVMAPDIKARVPATGAALDAYVGAVDSARIWIDAQLRDLTQRIKGTPAG